MEDDLHTVAGHVAIIRFIQATLEPKLAPGFARRREFDILGDQLRSNADPIRRHMGRVMSSFQPGLFVGAEDAGRLQDNLDLERWFRQPKGHERHIHGRQHAGVRIVQEGPTLIHAWDAHLRHPAPLSSSELLPYRDAQPPASQHQAITRRKIMRRARSETKRPRLLAELEKRYVEAASSPTIALDSS